MNVTLDFSFLQEMESHLHESPTLSLRSDSIFLQDPFTKTRTQNRCVRNQPPGQFAHHTGGRRVMASHCDAGDDRDVSGMFGNGDDRSFYPAQWSSTSQAQHCRGVSPDPFYHLLNFQLQQLSHLVPRNRKRAC